METGLHYNYFRYYDPEIGRYITADPLGVLKSYDEPHLRVLINAGIYLDSPFYNDLSLNHLYGYVDGSPINYTDPAGLSKKDNWYGHNDKNFQDWVHQLKQEEGRPSNLNYTQEELNKLKQQWKEEGRPGGKGSKSGRGGKSRFLKRCLNYIAPGLAEAFYPSPQRACDILQGQPELCGEL